MRSLPQAQRGVRKPLLGAEKKAYLADNVALKVDWRGVRGLI